MLFLSLGCAMRRVNRRLLEGAAMINTRIGFPAACWQPHSRSRVLIQRI